MASPSERICPLCGKEAITLWRHFWKFHKDSKLSEAEFLAKLLNLSKVPTCTKCGKEVPILYRSYRFRTYCSRSCSASNNAMQGVRIRNDKDKSTKTCPICGEFPISVWSHFHTVHKDSGLTDEQFLAKLLGYSEIPHCQVCGGSVIDYHNRVFKKYCSSKCSAIANDSLGKWKIENWDTWIKMRDDNWSRFVKGSVGIKGHTSRSDTEVKIFNRVKRLLPNERVTSNPEISGYFPDICLDDRKLIIECDGSYFHSNKFDYDLKRDKVLFNAGYKVRRLDTEYLRYSISDEELLYLIALETMIDIPYWERIPRDEIEHWKWDIYQTGPMKLLTYEH